MVVIYAVVAKSVNIPHNFSRTVMILCELYFTTPIQSIYRIVPSTIIYNFETVSKLINHCIGLRRHLSLSQFIDLLRCLVTNVNYILSAITGLKCQKRDSLERVGSPEQVLLMLRFCWLSFAVDHCFASLWRAVNQAFQVF